MHGQQFAGDGLGQVADRRVGGMSAKQRLNQKRPTQPVQRSEGIVTDAGRGGRGKMHRFRPRARGRAIAVHPGLRRSHDTIVAAGLQQRFNRQRKLARLGKRTGKRRRVAKSAGKPLRGFAPGVEPGAAPQRIWQPIMKLDAIQIRQPRDQRGPMHSRRGEGAIPPGPTGARGFRKESCLLGPPRYYTDEVGLCEQRRGNKQRTPLGKTKQIGSGGVDRDRRRHVCNQRAGRRVERQRPRERRVEYALLGRPLRGRYRR
jgi:hypothetical protein